MVYMSNFITTCSEMTEMAEELKIREEGSIKLFEPPRLKGMKITPPLYVEQFYFKT